MSEIATGKIRPILVVHAVTAAGLHDHYPMDAERVWSPWEMIRNQYERIQLYPYDPSEKRSAELPRYEAVEPALVRPSEAFGIVYKDLVAALKHNLSYGPTPVQPVYPFVYDWRQDNFLSARLLRDFVAEVIDRTRLMKHNPAKIPGGVVCDSVDLVGHSMGGLVIAGAIAGDPAWAGRHVRRVVTLGTPFRGANAAIQKLATGGGTLTGRDSNERERTMARVTPTVYQRLPSFHGAVVEANADADIFDPDTFQPSIPDTIAEFVASASAASPGRAEARRIAGEILTELLKRAKAFRKLTDTVSPKMLRPAKNSAPPEERSAWLAIVGAAEKTLIRTGIGRDQYRRRQFDFEQRDAQGRATTFCPEGWDGVTPETGDETVPLRGAIPPWEEAWRNSVVVQRSDFAWLGEIGDRVLCDQLGLHSTLPLLDLAQRWIINFFRPEWAGDRRLGQHGKLWGRPLPGFATASGGTATMAECEAEWGAMIPGLKLSRVP